MSVQLNNNNNLINNYISKPNPHVYNFKRKMKKKRKKENIQHITTNTALNEHMSRDHDEKKKLITKIATLNIRTLNSIKLSLIIEYMTKNNLDILGLTETNKLDKEIKHMDVDT